MTLLKIPKSLTNSNEMPIKPIKTHLNGNSFQASPFFNWYYQPSNYYGKIK